MPLPKRAYNSKTRRLVVRLLAPRLARLLPEDALFLLAVTDRDLSLGPAGFAYGWASFEHRFGVMSTARLNGDLRRTVALAAHECGHMLSIPHCLFFGCLMNGARSLSEADRRPLLLCPVCREKVAWNRRLDRLERYEAVAKALDALKMASEARRARHASAVTKEDQRG